jgi:putative transposase
VNHKKVWRLLRCTGLKAGYSNLRLSTSSQVHKKYPYLLSALTIDHADQLWGADIPHIRTMHILVYLVPITEWHSRVSLP